MKITVTNQNWEAIEKLILIGRLSTARTLVAKIQPCNVASHQMDRYLQCLRRVGEFERALLILEREAHATPAVDFQRALIWGELGGAAEAIRILNSIEFEADWKREFERNIQLGHFRSLQHEYSQAIEAYGRARKIARPHDSYLEHLALLNEVGHEIHARAQPESALETLKRDVKPMIASSPLLLQGLFYFQCLGESKLQRMDAARSSCLNALELGRIHRFRENLMLELTRFDLFAQDFERKQIAKLKRMVLAQRNSIYFDQFNFILGRQQFTTGQTAKAVSTLAKVLLGGRLSSYFAATLDFISKNRSLNDRFESTETPWVLDRMMHPHIAPLKTLAKLRLDRLGMPWLVDGAKKNSLQDESHLICTLAEQRFKFFEFQPAVIQIYNLVWSESFQGRHSLGKFHALLNFMRKSSDLNSKMNFSVKESRLQINLGSSVRVFFIRRN